MDGATQSVELPPETEKVEKVAKHLEQPPTLAIVICGPPAMHEAADIALRGLGYRASELYHL